MEDGLHLHSPPQADSQPAKDGSRAARTCGKASALLDMLRCFICCYDLQKAVVVRFIPSHTLEGAVIL